VIRRTFQLIHGVGPSREKDLWREGITRWSEFPPEGGPVALNAALDVTARETLAKAERALVSKDLATLGAMVPPREHCRLFAEFERDAVFFDIESEPAFGPSGAGRTTTDIPTVVSLFHADGFEVFLNGRDLEALPKALARWPLWVTFNGSAFDIPVLQDHFGELLPKPALHLDLCHVARRLGWGGGLKKIEEKLGFGRPGYLKGVRGLDAIFLWRYWKATKDVGALRVLVEYNLYDSIQLRTLAGRAYNQIVEKSGLDEASIPVFERGDVIYDVSRYLLLLGPEAAVGPEEALERARRAGRG